MKKALIALTICLGAVYATAQEMPQTLSLEQALSMTLSNNPSVQASQYQQLAARQERRAAIGLRMPKINVSGAYTYLGKDIGFDLNDLKGPAGDLAQQIFQSGLLPEQAIPPLQQMIAPLLGADWFVPLQDRSLGFVGGEVTLPIYLGGKINAANRAARIQERTSAAQGRQTVNALVSELVERYFGLALARQVAQVRQQVVDGVRQHLEDAIALEKNGMIAHSERLYVEFKMAEAERELQNALLQVETISSALSNTLGQQAEYLPVTTMFVLDRIEPLDYFREAALAGNPLLEEVALKKELAGEAVKLQRADFLPQVAAMGGGTFYNYQATKVLPRWAVGVGVNLKIFDGLSREYKYSAARHTARRVEILETKAENDISVLVEKLYNQMLNYGNQIASIEASIHFAEAYLASKNAAFLEGMSTSSDLVDAELNLAKVRAERMQAAYQYDLLLARLLEAAGLSDDFPLYLRRSDARPVTFE